MGLGNNCKRYARYVSYRLWVLRCHHALKNIYLGIFTSPGRAEYPDRPRYVCERAGERADPVSCASSLKSQWDDVMKHHDDLYSDV